MAAKQGPRRETGGQQQASASAATIPARGQAMTGRIDWPQVVTRAREIVLSYDTSVTLRQLFYRLVSAQVIPNTQAAYKRLSALTAEARRHGDFPALIDRGRTIHRYESFGGPQDALDQLVRWYRLDRTRGQDVSLYLGVEKAGMVVQLQSWFGDLGIPILALGGYGSQSYVDEVIEDVSRSPMRPDALDRAAAGLPCQRGAVLLYAGDFDPSGEDIDRDFMERTDCWEAVVRVALSAGQVRDYRLPVNPGKAADSRAAGFIERHGSLMQVELDALDPAALRELYQDAIDEYWDTSAYEAVLAQERADTGRLREAARAGGAA